MLLKITIPDPVVAMLAQLAEQRMVPKRVVLTDLILAAAAAEKVKVAQFERTLKGPGRPSKTIRPPHPSTKPHPFADSVTLGTGNYMVCAEAWAYGMPYRGELGPWQDPVTGHPHPYNGHVDFEPRARKIWCDEEGFMWPIWPRYDAEANAYFWPDDYEFPEGYDTSTDPYVRR